MAETPRIDELRRRVQTDPASFAFAALAEEYRKLGRHQEAIDTCRAGLARHPAYVSARATLGRALLDVGDLETAKAELEQVLRASPENLAALRGLAEIHRRAGELVRALERLRLASSLAPQDRELRDSLAAIEAEATAAANVLAAGGNPPSSSSNTLASAGPFESEMMGDAVQGAAATPNSPQLDALERFLSAVERERARTPKSDTP